MRRQSVSQAAASSAPAAAPVVRRPLTPAALFPRQHGAWATLLLSYTLGLAVAGHLSLNALLLLVALVAAMPARHGASLWLSLSPSDPRRRTAAMWTALCLIVAAGATAVLLLVARLWLLAPVGLLAAAAGLAMTLFEQRRWDRTLAGEMVGMAGLAVAAPAAAYVSRGAFGPGVVAVWLLATLVFCGSVLHVRYLARPRAAAAAGWASLVFHVLATGLVAASARFGLVPPLGFVALIPAMARAAWPVLAPRAPRPTIRRLGFQELAYSVLFVVATVIIFRCVPGAQPYFPR